MRHRKLVEMNNNGWFNEFSQGSLQLPVGSYMSSLTVNRVEWHSSFETFPVHLMHQIHVCVRLENINL